MQPSPTILAFDTSAAHCAAALLLNGAVHSRVEEMARGQGERLMVLLEEVLAEHDLTWAALDGVGVGTGPGNFTGIRIAVSAARGLALGLGKPAIGVSGFEASVHGQNRPVTAYVPAPRAQRYAQEITANGANAPRLEEGEAAAPPAKDLVSAIAWIAAERLAQDAPPNSIGGRPTPLYVRPADVAPPREQPPVILP